MADSILQTEKECFITQSTDNLHKHHIYAGSRRQISENNGFTVYLRADWHNMASYGVHNDKSLDLHLKRLCQTKYEETHSREEFIKLIGKSYL